MRLKLALWALTVFAPAACADPLSCQAGAASIPVFDPTSTSGGVGNYTLDCTGGTPVSPAPLVNFTFFLNVSVLNTGGWILTDGANNFSGSLGLSNVVNFLSVPFDPPGPAHTLWTVENVFVNPSVLPPGSEFRETMAFSDPTIGVVTPDQLIALNAAPEPSTLITALLALWVILCLRVNRHR